MATTSTTNPATTLVWTEVPNEELQPGDTVQLWGPNTVGRIVSIEPYTGPFVDVFFAIAHVEPKKYSVSLSRDRSTTALRPAVQS